MNRLLIEKLVRSGNVKELNSVLLTGKMKSTFFKNKNKLLLLLLFFVVAAVVVLARSSPIHCDESRRIDANRRFYGLEERKEKERLDLIFVCFSFCEQQPTIYFVQRQMATMRPQRPRTSAKMRMRIMPTKSRGCWAVPRTPASPTMPIAQPEKKHTQIKVKKNMRKLDII